MIHEKSWEYSRFAWFARKLRATLFRTVVNILDQRFTLGATIDSWRNLRDQSVELGVLTVSSIRPHHDDDEEVDDDDDEEEYNKVWEFFADIGSITTLWRVLYS